MVDLQLVVGEFRKFRAKVTFHLGSLKISCAENKVIQFDGETMVMDGVKYPYPEARSAIKTGWLVLEGSNVGDFVSPAQQPVQVSPAQDSSGKKKISMEIHKDETMVTSTRKFGARQTTDGVILDKKEFKGNLVREEVGDGRTVGSYKKGGVTVTPSGEDEAVEEVNPSKAKTSRAGQSSEEGKVIAKLKPMDRRVVVSDASAADSAIQALDNSTRVALAPKGVRDISAMAGDTLEEIIPALDAGGRGGVLAKQGAAQAEQKRNQRLAQIAGSKKAAPVVEPVSEDAESDENELLSMLAEPVSDLAEPVSDDAGSDDNELLVLLETIKKFSVMSPEKAKHLKTEMARLLGGLAEAPKKDDVSKKQATKKAAVKAPTKPSVPVKAKPAAKPPVPVKVRAQSLGDHVMNGDDVEIAPGVRWNKKLHWKIRVNLAVTFKDKPEILALIRGYEVPSVVKLIDAKLAE